MIIIAIFLPECLSSESLNSSKLCFSSLRFTHITVGFWNLLDLRNSGFIKQSVTGLKTGVAPCAKRAYRAELGFFLWVKKICSLWYKHGPNQWDTYGYGHGHIHWHCSPCGCIEFRTGLKYGHGVPTFRDVKMYDTLWVPQSWRFVDS